MRVVMWNGKRARNLDEQQSTYALSGYCSTCYCRHVSFTRAACCGADISDVFEMFRVNVNFSCLTVDRASSPFR